MKECANCGFINDYGKALEEYAEWAESEDKE